MDYNRMMSMSMFLEKRHKPEEEIHIPKPSPVSYTHLTLPTNDLV